MNVVISKRPGGDSQRIFIDIKMNNNNLRCQLDAVSDFSIISENTWKNLVNRNRHTPKKLHEVYMVKNYNLKMNHM